MSGLSLFFADNAEKEELVEYVASKRYKDENGKPLMWKIGCITADEDEGIRKSCTKRIPIQGQKGAYQPEVDFNEYLAKLATRCIKYPDLNNAELQNSYGAMGAEATLRRMLKPGEYQSLLSKIQEVNDFATLDEEVEEAKN